MNEPRVRQLLTAFRVANALIIVIHGVYRILSGGVAPFGDFLAGKGAPLPHVLVWVISIVEVIGGLTVAFGRFVTPLCIWFAIELTMGILLVHLPNGWFVVGGGRNGMEFSVFLITCFLINAGLAQSLRTAKQT